MDTKEAKAISERARAFLESRKTLMLATADCSDRARTPTASYAPFVQVKGCDYFFVYLSSLSQHTYDLRKTKRVGVLFIEDEVDAGNNLFARKRISCHCVSSVIERNSVAWREVMEEFQKKFGHVFELILPLQDFTLFSLCPHETMYVEGFGRAYRMMLGLQNPIHIRGTGHGAKPVDDTST